MGRQTGCSRQPAASISRSVRLRSKPVLNDVRPPTSLGMILSSSPFPLFKSTFSSNSLCLLLSATCAYQRIPRMRRRDSPDRAKSERGLVTRAIGRRQSRPVRLIARVYLLCVYIFLVLFSCLLYPHPPRLLLL